MQGIHFLGTHTGPKIYTVCIAAARLVSIRTSGYSSDHRPEHLFRADIRGVRYFVYSTNHHLREYRNQFCFMPLLFVLVFCVVHFIFFFTTFFRLFPCDIRLLWSISNPSSHFRTINQFLHTNNQKTVVKQRVISSFK
jgi:hypothetical protein